jgi:hypothetical protein
MSYQAQADLAADAGFTRRVDACAVEQADVFKDDARPAFVALAEGVMRGDPDMIFTFVRLVAAAPGLADTATTGQGGTIDQSTVTDADILSAVQANWEVVAGLFFNEDGTPIEGAS